MKTVLLDIHENVAILKLNRPQVLNSMIEQLAIDAIEVLDQVRNNPAIRALIVTGEGRAFCAGAELNDELVDGNAQYSAGQLLNKTMQQFTNPWIQQLHELPIPVVAAVNGVAVGAGVGLALAADITIAAESAAFILSFSSKLGLVPDVGTTWHLARRIGYARAAAVALLGDKLTAQQAADWGLIWQCVADDQLHITAMTVAQRLASAPRHAALELRQALHHAQQATFVKQLDYERERQCELVEHADFREGVNAFKERRAAVFK